MSQVTTDEIVLEITEEALLKVLDVRAAEDDADELGLRVAVTGVDGVDYAYDLGFAPLDELRDDDHRYQIGDLSVTIPEESVSRLRGATLDLPSNPSQGGLVIRNPNRPNPLGDSGAIELTGTPAEKVTQLLIEHINPSLASHGGWAELERVDEDNIAYLTMGGGCQGCAMSAATLREGITVMISELVPEIVEVIDTTDHNAGESPYFA